MNSTRLSKRATSLALASLFGIGAVVVGGPASAGSATSNLPVSATVTANCTISTSAVAFGSYDPVSANASTALPGSGSVTIACTKGSAPTITLGLGSNASGTTRRMKAGAEYLTYELYQPASTTPNTACSGSESTVWGTTGAAIFTPTSPGGVAARTYNVCGSVAAGQDVSVGTYNDTVVATVNF
jgi:spore coat protein U domain-containing protein, fimbrial subunit CupE1/2/3/6